MLRATAVVRKPAVRADRVVDTVTLDHEGRQRRRVTLSAEGGLEFLLDLEKAIAVNDGDAFKLEDGRLVQVRAAPQKLLEIRAENPLRLMRMAYHVGNRHVSAEITTDAIYIEDDHVLAEMARGQGCLVTAVKRPFAPERGAYDHDCGHDHGHHSHDHAHEHHGHANRSHDDAHEHHAVGDGQHGHDRVAHATHAHEDHVHGPGCGHDHHHDHAHTHEHERGHAGHKHEH